MNTKQYLKQAYRMNEILECDLEELKRLRELSVSISSEGAKVSNHAGTKNTDKIGQIVARIVDLEQLINDEVDTMIEVKTNIYRAVSKVSDVDEQLVLRLRYLEFYKWEQIAEAMNYSWSQIHRIHNDALNNMKLVSDAVSADPK